MDGEVGAESRTVEEDAQGHGEDDDDEGERSDEPDRSTETAEVRKPRALPAPTRARHGSLWSRSSQSAWLSRLWLRVLHLCFALLLSAVFAILQWSCVLASFGTSQVGTL